MYVSLSTIFMFSRIQVNTNLKFGCLKYAYNANLIANFILLAITIRKSLKIQYKLFAKNFMSNPRDENIGRPSCVGQLSSIAWQAKE